MKMNTWFIILLLSSLGSLIPTIEAGVDPETTTPLADTYLSLAVKKLNYRARIVYKPSSVIDIKIMMDFVTEYVDIQFAVKETSCKSEDIRKDDFDLNKCEHKKNGRMMRCRACFSATNQEDILMHGVTNCTPNNKENSPLQSCETLHPNKGPIHPGAGTPFRF